MQNTIIILYKTKRGMDAVLTYKDFGLTNAPGASLNQQSDIAQIGGLIINRDTQIKIKKENVSIKLDEDDDKTYESTYKYLAIEETPIFFLIPVYDTDESEPIDWRIDTVYYSMENNDLVDHAFFLHTLEWINKYQEDSPFLTYLSPILNGIYHLTEGIVEDIENEVEIDDVYVVDEVLKSLKGVFFDYFYKEAWDSVLAHDIENILKDLYPDKYENYKDINIWELYDTDEDFRKELDQRVQDTLEYWWDTKQRDWYFKASIAREIRSVITTPWQGNDYSRQKMVSVMYHKKLASLIHINEDIKKDIDINIHIEKINHTENKSNNKVITLDYLILIMASPEHIINCSFGSFNMVNRLDVLNAISDELHFTWPERLYYVSVHNILSVEAKYDSNGVTIDKIAFDFLIPNKDFSSFDTQYKINIRLDLNKMQIFFKNYIRMLNMLTRSSLFALKMYNRIFKSAFDINSTLIMSFGFLLPVTEM